MRRWFGSAERTQSLQVPCLQRDFRMHSSITGASMSRTPKGGFNRGSKLFANLRKAGLPCNVRQTREPGIRLCLPLVTP